MKPRSVGDEDPARLQRAPAAPERVLADGVEDHVVRLAVLREVFALVVDDHVGAERSHEVDVLRVAHRGDVRPRSASPAARLQSRSPRRRRRRRCSAPCQRRAFRHVRARSAPSHTAAASSNVMSRRLVRRHARFPDADVLRVGAASDPEYLVADLELGDGCTDRLDLACELHASDPPLRAEQSREDAAKNGSAAAEAAVGARDRRGVHLDEDLVLLGTGRGTSSIRRTSGGPYVSWTTALMRSRPLFRPRSARRCRSSARCPRTGAPRPRPRAGRCGRSRRGTRRSRAAA